MVGTYFRFCTRLFMPFISVKLERGSGFDWSNIFILFLMPCRPPSGGAVKFWLEEPQRGVISVIKQAVSKKSSG
jgi:hypothetical protein